VLLPVASPPAFSGFILRGGLAAFNLLTRPNRVYLRYLTCSPHEFPPTPLLVSTLAWLHVEQAIYMVNSFQFTRSARIILAYRALAGGNEKPFQHAVRVWLVLPCQGVLGPALGLPENIH
jgi:hypothetical protein